ncbi:hypothetical protein Tco_0121497 [Tanacetum coccineum]
MGLDDLYNNFKIVEQKVKKSAGASNDDKNLAFVTTSGASSTNNINTVNPEVSTATTKVNTASTEICTASFSDATVYAFLSTQPKGSQLVHEDLEQLHDDDLEEIDLKWNMALLSTRARKAPRSKDNINWNQGSSTKTVKIEDASEKAMCAIDGAGFDWSDMAEEEIQANMALMAFSDSELGLLRTELEKVKQEKEGVDFKIAKFDKSTKDFNEMLESQIIDNNKKGLGYSVVPPPHPLIYNRPNKLDLSYSGLEEFQQPAFEGYGLRANKKWVSDNEDEVKSPVVVEKKTVVSTIPKVDVVRPKQQEKPKPVRKPVKYAEMYRSKGPRGNQRNWNNLKSQQIGNDFVMNNKACFVCGSFDHLKKDCGKRIIKPVWKNTRRVNDHYSTRMTHSNPRRNMIPQAVLMRSGIKAVNTAKPKDAHNAVKRNRFNTVKASACWVWMPKNRVVDHVSKNISASVTLKRLDYIDAQGRFKSVMAWMDEQAQGRQECSKEKEESREECSKSRKTKKMKCLEESSQQRK